MESRIVECTVEEVLTKCGYSINTQGNVSIELRTNGRYCGYCRFLKNDDRSYDKKCIWFNQVLVGLWDMGNVRCNNCLIKFGE